MEVESDEKRILLKLNAKEFMQLQDALTPSEHVANEEILDQGKMNIWLDFLPSTRNIIAVLEEV